MVYRIIQTLVTDLHWHLFKIQQCWWTSASFFVALDAAPVITGAWLPHHSYVTVILVISQSSYLSQRWSPSMLFILGVRYPCNFTTFSNCINWYQTPSVQNIHISGTFFFFFKIWSLKKCGGVGGVKVLHKLIWHQLGWDSWQSQCVISARTQLRKGWVRHSLEGTKTCYACSGNHRGHIGQTVFGHWWCLKCSTQLRIGKVWQRAIWLSKLKFGRSVLRNPAKGRKYHERVKLSSTQM